MISFGKNIRQANDPLSKIEVETVYKKIKEPNQKLVDYIEQLRTVATMDIKKYRILKIKLPYLVAATFNPGFRKKDTFAYTQHFIIDIDHVNEKELDLDTIFKKISADKRVLLAFRSPSNDGIKLFFKLKEKCYDIGKYTLFYKFFAQKFSNQYNLEQVLDKSTSDVSRACFVSFDPEAYFNNNAETIEIKNFIDFENEETVSKINFELKENEKADKEKTRAVNKNNTDINRQDLPNDILLKIREKLNPAVKKRREKNIYVPEQLDEIIEDIKKQMDEYEIKTESIKKINYGKQFNFSVKNIWCEINIFYGKKGFTVVKTTKNGSNKELAESCAQILTNLLY
jgi:hypothetical protein